MKNPEHIKIAAKEMTADRIDQYFVKTKEFEKFDVLTRLLDVERPELAIVFGRTKRRVDELIRGLKLRGYRAEGMHGDLDQNKRLAVCVISKQDILTFWLQLTLLLVDSTCQELLTFITTTLLKTKKAMFTVSVVPAVLVNQDVQ